MSLLQNLSWSAVPSSLPFFGRVRFGRSVKPISRADGGWTSRLGRCRAAAFGSLGRCATGVGGGGRLAAEDDLRFLGGIGAGTGGREASFLTTGYSSGEQLAREQQQQQRHTSSIEGRFLICFSKIDSTRWPMRVTGCSGPLKIRQL